MENVSIINNKIPVAVLPVGRQVCHDCGKKINLSAGQAGTEGKEIKNGFLLSYNVQGEIIKVFKCKDCFKNNPALKNFRKCEVYSRIVGYLRPVNQWHIGKKQEFKERKEFSEV